MRLYYLITREVKCLEVREAVQRAVVDLGDLVVAEDEDAEAGGGLEAGAGQLLELVVGQVEAGEAGQGALVPAQAHVLHILDAVVREVEVDEALEAAQLLVRQPPQARVGEVEPGQSAQPRQRPGLGVSVAARPACIARCGGRGGWRGAGGCARPAGTRGPPARRPGWRAPRCRWRGSR